MAQKSAAYNSSGAIIAFYDSIVSPPPSGVAVLEITDQEWQECISNPGWTVSNGALVAPTPPTTAELLAQAQATQTATLQAAYKAAVNAPVSYKNAAGVTSTYPSGGAVALNGQTAQQNLEAAIIAGSAAWTLGKWLDTNSVAQTFTYSDLQGLAAAMSAAVTLDWQDLVAAIAQVQAATTVAEVQAVVWP